MDDDVRPSRILHFFGVQLEKLVINSHKKIVLTRNRVHVDSLKLHLFLEGLTTCVSVDTLLTCGVFTVPVHPFL